MTSKSVLRVAVVSATTLALTAAAVSAAATASAAPAPTPGAIVSDGASAKIAAIRPTASVSFAGFSAALPSSTTASVGGTITVPTLTCTSTTTAPVYVLIGLFGGTDSFLESGGVFKGSCTGTTPKYEAFIITNSNTNSAFISVAPGDKLVVKGSVKRASNTFTLTDSRTAQRLTASGAGFTPTGAQLTTQGGVGQGQFPAFTNVVVSGATVNGAALGAANPVRYQQETADGKLLIKVGQLSSTAKKFATAYVANS